VGRRQRELDPLRPIVNAVTYLTDLAASFADAVLAAIRSASHDELQAQSGRSALRAMSTAAKKSSPSCWPN
jgi:hypothetical protein